MAPGSGQEPGAGEHPGEPGTEAGQPGFGLDPRDDVVASTVEALQARVEGAERDALRGTIDPHAPPSMGQPDEPTSG
jgi:hypothetical protein